MATVLQVLFAWWRWDVHHLHTPVSDQAHLLPSCVSSLSMPLDFAGSSLGIVDLVRLDEYVFSNV